MEIVEDDRVAGPGRRQENPTTPLAHAAAAATRSQPHPTPHSMAHSRSGSGASARDDAGTGIEEPTPPVTPPSSMPRHPPIFPQELQKSRGFRKVSNAADLRPPPRPQKSARGAIVKHLTKDLLAVYHQINPSFQYQSDSNPRRVLTKPSKPMHNDGCDNEDGDYILYVNEVLGATEGQQYLILDILGAGTFGQVVKCQNTKTKELVAVKVIKNKPAYYNQSLVEVAILEMLNNQYDPNDKHHVVRMHDTFVFRSHLCIVFEMLSVNLYELIKQNGFRGLSTNLVRVFVAQILDALSVLNRAKIIHCDLKPENILLKNLESPSIKVIDYGSACHENQTVYTYIQSRFYRSPEVLMGLPYTSSIDMWSLGCIAAELFLGLPLFPGSSEYNQVSRIVEMLGVPPPYMIEKGKQAHQFYEKRYGPDGKPIYRLKPMETYMRENNCVEQPSKRYFSGITLDEVVGAYPVTRKGLSSKDVEKEMQNRQSFVDFLRGLLNLNPLERWSPQQARMHPFVTGEKFTGPFIPPSRRTPAPSGTEDITQVKSSGSSHRVAQRPRANTISSSTMDRHNVPPQLQRLVELSYGSSDGERRVAKARQDEIIKGAGAEVSTPSMQDDSGDEPQMAGVAGDPATMRTTPSSAGTPSSATPQERLAADMMEVSSPAVDESAPAAAQPDGPYGAIVIPASPADPMETRGAAEDITAVGSPAESDPKDSVLPEPSSPEDAMQGMQGAGSGPGPSESRTFSSAGMGTVPGEWVFGGAGNPSGGDGQTQAQPASHPSAPVGMGGLIGLSTTMGGVEHFFVPTKGDGESGGGPSVTRLRRRTDGFIVPSSGLGDVDIGGEDVAVATAGGVSAIRNVADLKAVLPNASTSSAEAGTGAYMTLLPPPPETLPYASLPQTFQPATAGSRHRTVSADSAFVDFSAEDAEGKLTPGVASMGNDSGVSLSPRSSNTDSAREFAMNRCMQQGRRHTLPSIITRGGVAAERRNAPGPSSGSSSGSGADGEARPGGRRRSINPEYGHLQTKKR